MFSFSFIQEVIHLLHQFDQVRHGLLPSRVNEEVMVSDGLPESLFKSLLLLDHAVVGQLEVLDLLFEDLALCLKFYRIVG